MEKKRRKEGKKGGREGGREGRQPPSTPIVCDSLNNSSDSNKWPKKEKPLVKSALTHLSTPAGLTMEILILIFIYFILSALAMTHRFKKHQRQPSRERSGPERLPLRPSPSPNLPGKAAALTSCSESPSMISEISCSLRAMVAERPVPLWPTLQRWPKGKKVKEKELWIKGYFGAGGYRIDVSGFRRSALSCPYWSLILRGRSNS
ncbi:hypothetical protein L345_18165, partial [Ophiophagus hannah]